jgi:hypothetical protein
MRLVEWASDERRRDVGRNQGSGLRLARLPGVLALIVMVGTVFGPAAANATIPKVVAGYSAVLSPATATAGSTVTTSLKVTNESSPAVRVLGWTKVSVPAGFTVTAVGTPTTFKANGSASSKKWTVTQTAGGFVLKPKGLLDVLLPKESVAVSITGKAPCAAGTLQFETAASLAELAWKLGDRWPLTGTKPTLTVTGSCGKLAIISVNGGADPTVGNPFPVVVELQTPAGAPLPAASPTPVTLNVTSGNGALSTTTGTIPAGATRTTITTSYNKVENDVAITASSPGVTTSDPAFFEVLAIVVTGPATPGQPLTTCIGDTTPANPVCATVVVRTGHHSARVAASSTTAITTTTTPPMTFTLSEQSCVLDAEQVCIGSLIGLLGSFGSGAVATITLEYDASIPGLPPYNALELFYELAEGEGFTEAPNCGSGSETYRAGTSRVPMTVPVVDPKPVCVSSRFQQGDGDRVIVALFDEDPRFGTR